MTRRAEPAALLRRPRSSRNDPPVSRTPFRFHFRSLSFTSLAACLFALGCSAGGDNTGSGGSGGSLGTAQGGGIDTCPTCNFKTHLDCQGNETNCADLGLECSAELGCVACPPGAKGCNGNQVVECANDGTPTGPVVEECDVNAGLTCSEGSCKTPCEVAGDKPSNVGCEFWAVDLDQQDGVNDPASAPWGLVLANSGTTAANVSIQINNAAVGAPADLADAVPSTSIPAGGLIAINMPTRELDCGTKPNDYASPGTCLSSRAFRITSSAPIVVYQFNVFQNQYSNDASLLLPTSALGNQYRVIGWNAGHPIKLPIGNILDRSYVTVVGTTPNTEVTVRPSWKIKGNPPIAATAAGGEIKVTLNPFDVLNLETDDGTISDDPKTVADLSGTAVYSSQPVAVFSGTESTQVPGSWEIPTYPGWDPMASFSKCCLDHLEDQLFPMESVGTKYVIARSPVRSTSSFREPDIIRFVGAAEPANITTTLPAPFNQFLLQPGEVKTTWTQNNFTATGDKPFLVAQLLVSQGYVEGPVLGDPALTIIPPVDQYRAEYIVLIPPSWSQNWVVITTEVGANVAIDGTSPSGCVVEPAGEVEGVTYESRKCPLTVGAHAFSGDKAFGIITYGYGSAGSYAVAGGADVKKIYDPPIPK